MSSSDTTTYPDLGFNPVPGVPGDVDAVTAVLKQASASLKESGSLLTRVRDSGSEVWQGQAGDAFRSHVDSQLSKQLTQAQSSMETAFGILTSWHGDLVGFKSTATQLDAEAAAAKQAGREAAERLASAQQDPGFRLVGRTFDTATALQQAQHAVDAAQHELDLANQAVSNAEAELKSVLTRAHELESQHEALAKRLAQALDHAASDLAPHKPGMFSRMWNDFTSSLDTMGSWVADHLDVIHSVLSTISAIAGLVALLTPPPIDAIALGVALVAGAGALAVDLANPEFRSGIGQLLQGNINKQSLGAAATGVGDVLSVVPGATALGKAGSAGLKAAHLGEEAAEGSTVLPKMVKAVSAVAKKPGLTARGIANQSWVRPVLEGARVLPKDATEAVLQHTVAVIWKGKGVAMHLYDDVKGDN